MSNSSAQEPPADARLSRADTLLVVGAAAMCFLMLVVMLFLVPVLERALRGHPIPFVADLVIRFSNLIRANLISPVPIASVPLLVAVAGLIAKARGAASLGRALMLSGLALVAVVLGVSGACLLAFVRP